MTQKMHKNTEHIHHHAQKHHEAETKLRDLVSGYNPVKERIFPIFAVTFVIVLLTLLLFRNWGNIMNIISSLQPKSEPEQTSDVEIEGYKTGIISNTRIDSQAAQDYRQHIASLPTAGSSIASEATMAFGQERGEEPKAMGYAIKNSTWVTNYLSTGQHLTLLSQKNAKALQKSIISTYYFGEKTVDINSTIETDSKILSKMKNALSVDIFQYLNQSVNRSDSLDEYLHLLSAMSDKAGERIKDLQYKIDFLSSDFNSKEKQIKTSEQVFFDNLKIFDGPNADQELGKFVGLQSMQTEIKAKLGAYTSLQDYYKFFKPKFDNLIKAIDANRAPLIAGVKVVEIQNMTLPLIIKSK
jgi:hypothetical protein